MVHTQLAIVEPSNHFADLPFNLTFNTVNIKTKKSTINLAVNRDDGTTAGKMLTEREKRRWRDQGGGRGRRDGVWFNKEGNDDKGKGDKDDELPVSQKQRRQNERDQRRRGRARQCNINRNGSEGDDDGAVV